jgi:hypothetical protein
MRSSRPQKARAQDDRLKNSLDGIFRLDPHVTLWHQMRIKNLKFDMPWHVATLIKEWAQYIVLQ